MSESQHPTPRNRAWLPQLFVVGNLALAILVGGGIAYSIHDSGRLPHVRFGYAGKHQQMLFVGHRGEAIAEMRTAAIVDFDNAAALVQLLSTANELHDSDGTITALRGLLHHTPDDSQLHGELAGALLEAGRLEEAEVHSRYALMLEPESDRWHSTHGAVMLGLDRLDEAAASYRRALELNPDSAPAKRALTYPLKDY